MNKNYKSSNINNLNQTEKSVKTNKTIKSTKNIKNTQSTKTLTEPKIPSKKNNYKNKTKNYENITFSDNSDLNSISSNHNDFNYDLDEEDINNLINDIDKQSANPVNFANQTNQTNPTNPTQPDLTHIFKIFENMFNNSQTPNKTFVKNNFSNDNIIQIRKDSIMAKFEHQIKKQLGDIVEVSRKTNKYGKTNEEINELEQKEELDENYIEQQKETISKLNSIMESIENDKSFIGLNEDDFINELKTVPNQEDFDDFCKELEYEKKLTYSNSTKREKLFTIMYTIGNYCIEPNIDIKRIILFIVKFEVIRNDLINLIIKMNRLHKRCDVLDCITSDMLFTGLGYLLSSSNMKIISKNIAYYFAKIFYM